MTDTFSQEERSAVMRSVKSNGNKSTEDRLIQIFKKRCITGWRRNYPVAGKPDFVFLRRKVAVFADGCFWHGHNCRNIIPKQNAEYWSKKRLKNISRDKKIAELFNKRGWTVIRFWECDIKKESLDIDNLESLIK
jgi:DNA mismatch endonuclease (patch repair protein)